MEGLEDLLRSPELAAKRPLDDNAAPDRETPEPKRIKTETRPEEAEAETEEGQESVEDGLELLIQNTLANINDLVGQGAQVSDAIGPDEGDPMSIDSVPPPELSPAPVTFADDPMKYIRQSNINALGNLVG